jgi:hypothetical protein
VSVEARSASELEALLSRAGVAFREIGTVGGEALAIGGLAPIALETLAESYFGWS